MRTRNNRGESEERGGNKGGKRGGGFSPKGGEIKGGNGYPGKEGDFTCMEFIAEPASLGAPSFGGAHTIRSLKSSPIEL